VALHAGVTSACRRVALQVYSRRPPLTSFGFTSMYQVNSINHFGVLGGFHRMCERLDEGTRGVDMPFWLLWRIVKVCIVLVVGPIVCVRVCLQSHRDDTLPPTSVFVCLCRQVCCSIRSVLRRSVSSALTERLSHTVFPTLLAMSHDMLKFASKEQLVSVTHFMELLMNECLRMPGRRLPALDGDSDDSDAEGDAAATPATPFSPHIDVKQLLSDFRLDLARKLLSSPQVRLRGCCRCCRRYCCCRCWRWWWRRAVLTATVRACGRACMCVYVFLYVYACVARALAQLEKRLIAMRDIGVAIEAAGPVEGRRNLYRPLESHTITVPSREWLAQWMIDNKVRGLASMHPRVPPCLCPFSMHTRASWRTVCAVQVIDELFGSGLHAELARRSTPILQFLASCKCITEEHITAMWLAARGKHEAVAVVLYRLLVDLSRSVDSTLRCHIVTLVRALQFSEWTAHVLSFVRDFTLAATQADGWVLRYVLRRIDWRVTTTRLHTHRHHHRHLSLRAVSRRMDVHRLESFATVTSPTSKPLLPLPSLGTDRGLSSLLRRVHCSALTAARRWLCRHARAEPRVLLRPRPSVGVHPGRPQVERAC
jgi:hypothetical protein